MRYKPFYPGDKVMTIVEYEGIPNGTIGKIKTKWGGTAYVVRVSDGSFQWLNSNEFDSEDPGNHHNIEEGWFGVVKSDEHQHEFLKKGDHFQVVKIAHDVDYYGVQFSDKIKWFTGFQLAKYT